MKIDGHGKAKILTQEEIQLLFSPYGFKNERDRALFAICLFTACRINEACCLRIRDVYQNKGIVNPYIIIRKGTTKNKLETRTVPVIEDLRNILVNYYPPVKNGIWWLFQGASGVGHIRPDSASRVLRRVCKRLGIIGVSTHSFRRTALTTMSNNRIPLRVIQEISGHHSLDELQKYLEVTDEQLKGAVAGLTMLSPVNKNTYLDPPLNQPLTQPISPYSSSPPTPINLSSSESLDTD